MPGQRKKSFILLTPGPVNLTPEVRNRLSQPALHHRSLEFKKILKSLGQKLQEVFQTSQPVLILNSSGTGAMEAALSNTCSPGESVLFLSAGKFGERWRDMGLAYGLKVKSLEAPWGKPVSSKKVQQFLKKNPKTKAVFVQACETSTATNHPIKELGEVLKKYPETLFIVDGVTGLGSMELKMDKWGIDVLIGGSQKSFQLPTGLAFIALSKKAWARQSQSQYPKYYFDLRREKQALEKEETAFSSNVTFIRALEGNRLLFSKSGWRQQLLKCQALARSTWAFCREMDLKLFSSQPSFAVTAIQMPQGCLVEKIKNNLEKIHGIVIAGGQGILKDKILRIGHLGPITSSQHLKGLKAFGQELQKTHPTIYTQRKLSQALKKAKTELSS